MPASLAALALVAVFGWLAQVGRLSDAEMLKTFNCGIGMVIVAAKAEADAVFNALQEAGEAPLVVGEIVAPGGEKTDAKGKGNAWAVSYTGALRYA